MTSDWIAHGILDSIVDSFFPLLEEIGREVVAIEDLAAGRTPVPGTLQREAPSAPAQSIEKAPPIDFVEIEKHSTAEKHSTITSPDHVKPRFSLPRLTFPLALRRLKRFVNKWLSFRVREELPQRSATHTSLRRMARTRRLVTSLTRLLATKSEVVAQIRKRLLTSSSATLPNGTKNSDDDLDVALHMGDVQDHILSLQYLLVHYERILSQSHPTYLSQLGIGVASARNETDKAVVYLTTINMADMCIQMLVGVFSLNVDLPRNVRIPTGRYNVLGFVFALSVCFICAYAYTVKRWWNQARAKRRQRRLL